MPMRRGGALLLRKFAVALAAGIGVAASLGVFVLVCAWQNRVAEIEFRAQAHTYLRIINNEIENAATLLTTVGAYFNSNETAVDQQEFLAFSRSVHDRVVGLRDIAWAPRVTAADRAAFEAAQRAAGHADYEIRERDAQGRLVRAGDRAEYYPLTYIDSGGRALPIFGFDLISEPVRRDTMQRATRNGTAAATPPVALLTTAGRRGGVLGLLPVKLHGPGGSPAGLVVGVFETGIMIESIVAAKARLDKLNVYFYDPAGAPDDRLIYWRPATHSNAPPPTEAELRAGEHWEGHVTLFDRQWGAIFTPGTPHGLVTWSVQTVVPLLVGLVMTAMVVAYLAISHRRTSFLEKLTAELHETTQRLHRHAEKIAHMARHDALTGLPNRVVLAERLEQAVGWLGRGQSFAVLCLDLDQFKAVNDTLGHAAGDRLLCQVAERIGACVREVDTVARLGGDEFAIILADTAAQEDAALIASRLIAVVGQGYEIGPHTVTVGVSIGIATAPADGRTAETLLMHADLALYAAKDAGRGTYRFFAQDLRARMEARMALEARLRRALAEGEFELHYQPVIDLARDRVAGFEALLRWNDPERGMVRPDQFLPLAEERGLIVPMGAWVLRTACQHAARWPVPVRVAVNISPVQFRADGLVDTVLAALDMAGLPAERLQLEVTETAALQEPGTLAALNELRALGVHVAFDDFGTGFSSLTNLVRIPFDIIKIDQSFLGDLKASQSTAEIVRAIVALGNNLGLTTSGEGVDTPEQLAFLKECKCAEAQGYLFSPPRPNADVPRMLRELGAGVVAG